MASTAGRAIVCVVLGDDAPANFYAELGGWLASFDRRLKVLERGAEANQKILERLVALEQTRAGANGNGHVPDVARSRVVV